jgi:tetratricopeptide (TPR) repeat protein
MHPSVLKGGRRLGLKHWSLAATAAALLAAAAPTQAVITDELLHDTARTRGMLKEEIGSTLLQSRPTGAPTQAAPAARGDFETIWFAREKYLQIGENDKAQQQLRALWERALVGGVRNLPEYSAVLLREVERRKQSGNWEEASRALGWAHRLAPDELSVYATGAMLALRRNPFNPVPVWDELAGGTRAVGRSFRLQAWLRANLLGTLASGLAFFFTVAVGVAAVVAAPRFVHDVREAIGFGSPRVRTLLAWGVLATPALVGLSPWWWVIVAGLLLWPYFPLPARVLAASGAVFLLVLPLAVRERAALLTLSERPLLAAVLQVREGNWSPADYATLKAEADRGTAGVPVLTTLGVAARRLGRLEEAETSLRAGLKAAPDDAVLWLNLGNVAFARQDVAGAIAGYTKAVEIAPRLFAPHYNLGIAYRESFKFAEGEAETRLAAELDPEAAAFYSGLDPSRLKGFTVDALPPAGDLWTLARAPGDEQAAATHFLWESLMLGAPIGLWPVVVAALLTLGAGLGAWRINRGTASACTRCGRVFCPRCQPGRRGEFCLQCHHIFVKKEGVDARARVQKMSDIKSRQRRLRLRHLACAAIAPGGGHLSAGAFLPGLLLLLPASVLEPRVLFGHGAFPSPWSLGSAASSSFGGAAAVVLAALWLLSLWLTFRFKD